MFAILLVLQFQYIEGGWGGSRVNNAKPVTNGGRNLYNKYVSAGAQGNSLGPKFDGNVKLYLVRNKYFVTKTDNCNFYVFIIGNEKLWLF